LRHFLNFLNHFSGGMGPLTKLIIEMQVQGTNGLITDIVLIPKELLVTLVFDKFITYLVDHAMIDETKPYAFGTIDAYFSAVKTYFIMSHPVYSIEQNFDQKVFREIQWKRIRKVLTDRLNQR